MAKKKNGIRYTTKPATRSVSPVRNSSIPKTTSRPASPSIARKSVVLSHEMIARRAYEISQSPQCGSEFDNWVRAERELRAL
jgi:hypothetical protein